jgi:hypothetical protein
MTARLIFCLRVLIACDPAVHSLKEMDARIKSAHDGGASQEKTL